MTIGQKLAKAKELAREASTPEAIRTSKELRRFRNSYIFVNTNFKRKGEPIFALAFSELHRNVAFNKSDLIFKSDEEVFELISAIVKQHFLETKGNIGIWGNIVSYIYHHSDGKTYLFDKDGLLRDDEKVIESKAVLSLNGKEILTDKYTLTQQEKDVVEKKVRRLHTELFPEEYDEIGDSTQDAKERKIGKNPMSKEYIKRMDDKRVKLGFNPLSPAGYNVTDDTMGYCKNLVVKEIKNNKNDI